MWDAKCEMWERNADAKCEIPAAEIGPEPAPEYGRMTKTVFPLEELGLPPHGNTVP
jgi:hypothetical protein